MKVKLYNYSNMKIINRLKKVNINFLVAGSALFVSVCALFLSIQEVRIMRSQQKASMYPYITIGKSYNARGFGIQMKNSGNGLAKISSYQIYNDSMYFKDWFDVLQTLAPDAKNINYNVISTDGNIRNKMISPGENVNLITLKWTSETRKLEELFNTLKVKVIYSSLLDEHWMVEEGTPNQIEKKLKLESAKEFEFSD